MKNQIAFPTLGFIVITMGYFILLFLGNISGIEDDKEIIVLNCGYPERVSYPILYKEINFLWEILLTRLIYFTDIRYVI